MLHIGRFFGAFSPPPPAGVPKPDAQQKELIVYKTKKEHLKLLELGYCPESLTSQVHRIGKNRPVFFYSNDAIYISSYLGTCYPKTYTPIDHTKSTINSIGIIIGNGYVLSLLPDICADDILLIDTQPVVHYFILAVRELILQANIDDEFGLLKAKLIAQIRLLENTINHQATVIDAEVTVVDEMRMLGSKHFLANKTRFVQCREALKTKELLPIEIDISDIDLIKLLSETIELSECNVSFLNLTNVADYTGTHKLYSSIQQLPLADNLKIITTQLVSDINKRVCYVSTNLSEFHETLSHKPHFSLTY